MLVIDPSELNESIPLRKQKFYQILYVKVAPVGAFGAMAFTIGKYGLDSIGNLMLLVLTFYITSLLFAVIILGAVARYNGFSIIKMVRYIKR